MKERLREGFRILDEVVDGGRANDGNFWLIKVQVGG